MDLRLVLADSNPGLLDACLPDHYMPSALRDLALGQLLIQERSWRESVGDQRGGIPVRFQEMDEGGHVPENAPLVECLSRGQHSRPLSGC